MSSWVDAATVLITVPKLLGQQNQNNADFNVMMLKRSSKSSFYPNAYVFPGGRIDKADCDLDWLNLFCSVHKSFTEHFGKLKVHQTDGRRSPMFSTNAKNSLLHEVSYRICAIRETFEETGVLLSRTQTDDLDRGKLVKFGVAHQFFNKDDVDHWRKRVHDDASEFIKLFQEINCVPDIWSLHEWSNWLTPSLMLKKFSQRFDTVFYKVALKEPPTHSAKDNKEITHLIYNTPQEIINAWKSRKIILGPPQLYEIARLFQFSTYHDLAAFAANRGTKGMERLLPIRGVTSDGVFLSLYTNDYWYPKVNCDSVEIPLTHEEMLKEHPNQLDHARFDLANKNVSLHVSCKMRYGHIQPYPLQFHEDDSSKL